MYVASIVCFVWDTKPDFPTVGSHHHLLFSDIKGVGSILPPLNKALH